MAQWGRTGKTPPLWLDDVLHYDLRQPPAPGHHPWKDGPPVSDNDENYEVERRSKSCKHQYVVKPKQSFIPALDERPTQDASYKVAAICQKCRTHVDLEVRYSYVWGFKPCPDAEKPFHHLIYRSSEIQPASDVPAFEEGNGRFREKHILQCSSTDCGAFVHLSLKDPVVTAETIKNLVDPELLLARQDEVIRTEPQKMEGMSKAEGYDVLSDLRQYIRNAWDSTKPRGSTKGKIQLLNKRFMMRFGHSGMPCKGALESLGFKLEPEESWDPPHPNFEDIEPFQDPFNTFLDDADHELTVLMQQHPPRLRPQGTAAPPIPAQKEFNRALGSQDYNKYHAARTQDMNSMAPWYRGLGVLPDVADEAVIYAYDRQCMNDPEYAHRYLDYLRSIASLRNSEALQLKYVTEESAGKYTTTQLDEAYLYFGFDPRTPPTDEQQIIGTFSSRLEDAPMQESDMRRELRVIGTHMRSQRIMDVADESLATYEQALAFLDVTRDTPDDFVPATVAVKLSDNLNPEDRRRMETKCQKAVKLIADHRHSLALREYLQTGELGTVEMDIGEAYSLLGIDDRTLDDQMIFATYQLRLEDNKANADTYDRALRTIAKHRNSYYLEQATRDAGQVIDQAPPDWPVGLGNIGNTCYLNSLLQFCFTINGLREVALNFDSYRMDITADAVSHKKVGSRKVSLAEIQRSQKFAVELRKLFQSMITSPRASITPEEQLARLTLIGPSTYEAARRRSTLQGKPPMSINPSEVAAADPIPIEEPTTISEQVVASPVDETPNTTDGFNTRASSETTLASNANDSNDEIMIDVDTKSQQEQILNDKENLPPSKTENSRSRGTVDQQDAAPLSEASPSKVNAQAGALEHVAQKEPTVSISENANIKALEPPSRPPPVPPRPRVPERRSTIQDLEDITKQQDVTEVMGNVLFQLSCAIKPTGFDKDGEQLDQIKNLFFGKTKQTTLQKEQEPITEIQPFSDIKVNVADGSRDVYQALEAAFDEQDITSNGKDAIQFSSITQLPPIFQVQIQRTQFDSVLKRTYKSVNRLELFQTIFLDRFLDTDIDSPLMERRREAWKWKKELAALESRKAELMETKEQPGAPQALADAREVLMKLQMDLAGDSATETLQISPSTISSLHQLENEARRELNNIESTIPDLNRKISTQYTDLRQHPYSLHSIFVHRGSSSFGHYWIYIYDFEREVWRKYNDSNVTEVRDTNEIFKDLEKAPTGGGSPPTSVYLVYVEEARKIELVGSVVRHPVEEVPQQQDHPMKEMEEVQPHDPHNPTIHINGSAPDAPTLDEEMQDVSSSNSLTVRGGGSVGGTSQKLDYNYGDGDEGDEEDEAAAAMSGWRAASVSKPSFKD